MTRILTILSLLTILSCQDKKSLNKKAISNHEKWDILKIRIDDKSFWVPASEDTCFYSLGITNEIKTQDDKIKPVVRKMYKSKAQRDTIYKIALEAISNPTITNQEVSDYAGQYVSISLEYSRTSISCAYSSISDWTKISPTLQKLNDLTFGSTKAK